MNRRRLLRDSMTGDDGIDRRTADEIPEWELEEMIRSSLDGWRPDIAGRLRAWLDERIAAYEAAKRRLQ